MNAVMLRSLLVAASCAAVMPLLIAAQLPVPAGPAVDPDLQFEVASIKPYDASSGLRRMMMQPGRLDATGVPTRLLLRQALRVQDYQIIGAPRWVDTDVYAIVAKAADGAPLNGLPVMLANLLKERFQLVTHPETRELPVFHLMIARSDGRLGPNLKASAAECQAMIESRRGGAGPAGGPGGAAVGRGGPPLPGTPGGPPLFDPVNPPCGSMRLGPGIAGAGGQPLAQLAQLLSQLTGRPVIDKTGLAGIYDFSLKFQPDASLSSPFGPAPPGPPPPVDPDAANLFTAIHEQLGLKLENQRGPVEVIVIDRIEQPTLD